MTEPTQSLYEALNNLLGGAATTLIAAFTGRAMYHAGEVRAKRRPIWSRDLIWELPTAIGMALIGNAVSEYMGLSDEVGVGVIAVLSYLGPRGAGAMLERWIAKRD